MTSLSSKDIVGYFIGFTLFVVAVPAIMWLVSDGIRCESSRMAIFAIMAISGLALSIWSIVYMRNVGKGNPMDAFNHEVAPRTSQLMTDGPYATRRNPMLLGVLIYYLGVVILLGSAKAALVFVIYALLMSLQVRSEEKRLEKDFGKQYDVYRKRTKRLIPFVW